MIRSRAVAFVAMVCALVACDARSGQGPGKQAPANPEAPVKKASVIAHGTENDGSDRQPDGHTALVQEEEPKGPVVFQITSKLGVKTKVKVKLVSNPGVFFGFAFEPQGIDLLAVDRGHGLYIAIPLRQLKHIVNGEQGSVVTLADGTAHKGHVRTKIIPDPELDDMVQGLYLLSKAAEISNPTPSKPKAPNPDRKRFVLKVAERVPGKELAYPPARIFHVYHPGRHDEKFRFPMIVNGENFEVNPADFERIVVFKQEKEWHITVKAPEAKERTGKLDADNLRMVEMETTTGSLVALPLTPFDTGGDFVATYGFILERHHATGK